MLLCVNIIDIMQISDQYDTTQYFCIELRSTDLKDSAGYRM